MKDKKYMKKTYSYFKNWLKNKKVAVVGLGISNQPLLKILADLNLDLAAFDRMDPGSKTALRLKQIYANAGQEIAWHMGVDYLDYLTGFDVIFRTPIMMPYEQHLLAEKSRGALVTSEMEVFLKYCPGKVFAVTGSDGKSTTTSLIYSLLREQGYDVYVGGNIGRPLLSDIEKMTSDSKVVIELSSFQLIDLQVSPDVAVLTNVTPNHLDIHQSYAEYVNAKKQIYRHQSNLDRIVLNGNFKEFAEDWPTLKGEIVWFNQRYETCRHSLFKRQNGTLGYLEKNSEHFIPLISEDELHLLGEFNLENCLAAIGAVKDDVDLPHIKQAIRDFKGLEHRLEFVREVEQVKYYNSSIDSSPERSKNTISTFINSATPTVLIMGGKDKNSDYVGLGKIIAAATDKLILCGANADLIEQQIKTEAHVVGKTYKAIDIYHCLDYEEAVAKAYRIARPGEVVLLSPAGTSFDKFSNFEERGELFKKLVGNL